MPSKTIWIYGLIDPRDQMIKYIGQTCNLKQRYSNLMSKGSMTAPRIKEWVQEVKLTGEKPKLVILQITDQENAGVIEQNWITHFKNAGAPLLNQQFYVAHDYRSSANWWNKEKKSRWNT